MVIMGTNLAFQGMTEEMMTMEQVLERQKQIQHVQQMAQEALNRATGHIPLSQYKTGDIVWLDVCNLPLAVPTAKLALK